jgi:lysophospholipid acyltransferase
MISHIYRQIWNPKNSIDLSGPMMVLAVKVSSIAWNLLDGYSLSSISESTTEHEQPKLSTEQRFYAIEKFPTLLEFLGFMFYFATFLCGPSIEFRDYLSWTHGHLHAHGRTESSLLHSPDNATISLTPLQTLRPSLLRLLSAIFWGALFIMGGQWVSVEYFESDAYLKQSTFWWRLFMLYPLVLHTRAKFYFVWLMSEGAAIAMGFGVHRIRNYAHLDKLDQITLIHCRPIDKDNQGDLKEGGQRKEVVVVLATDGMSNNRIRSVEFSSTFGQIYRSWNIKTHHWLKQSVYFRLQSSRLPWLKRQAAMWTYVTSAFWHGFYPGYYFTFVLGGLGTVAERTLRKKILPQWVGPTAVQNVPSTVYSICCLLFLSYMTFPFVLLQFWNSLEVMQSLYFFIHLIIIGIEVIGSFQPYPSSQSTNSDHKSSRDRNAGDYEKKKQK